MIDSFAVYNRWILNSVDFHIQGVNDGKECKKRAEVVDITLSGPARGQNALYSKYTSLYSPFSSLNGIRSTYPAISTGVVREFRAVEGEFREGKSLSQTLDGDVHVDWLPYSSSEGVYQLFSAEPPPVPIRAFAGDSPGGVYTVRVTRLPRRLVIGFVNSCRQYYDKAGLQKWGFI